jgi:hypothetical protein
MKLKRTSALLAAIAVVATSAIAPSAANATFRGFWGKPNVLGDCIHSASLGGGFTASWGAQVSNNRYTTIVQRRVEVVLVCTRPLLALNWCYLDLAVAAVLFTIVGHCKDEI